MMKQPTLQPAAEFHSDYKIDQFEDNYSEITRGDKYSTLISSVTAPMLRIGFLCQTVALLAMTGIYYGNSGTSCFTFDVFNMPEDARSSAGVNSMMLAFLLLNFVGTMLIL